MISSERFEFTWVLVSSLQLDGFMLFQFSLKFPFHSIDTYLPLKRSRSRPFCHSVFNTDDTKRVKVKQTEIIELLDFMRRKLIFESVSRKIWWEKFLRFAMM